MANTRCGRGNGVANYWNLGYGYWIDAKDFSYEFKPITRSGCADQVYHGYGMTFSGPSGCGVLQ